MGSRAGGLPQPGPIFQALPQPLPLPQLPQPQRPAEFQMVEAPESAPMGEAQPRAQLQEEPHRPANQYFGTFTRKLQQAPEDGPPGALPEPMQPFAAEAPLTAPGVCACLSMCAQCHQTQTALSQIWLSLRSKF